MIFFIPSNRNLVNLIKFQRGKVCVCARVTVMGRLGCPKSPGRETYAAGGAGTGNDKVKTKVILFISREPSGTSFLLSAVTDSPLSLLLGLSRFFMLVEAHGHPRAPVHPLSSSEPK